MPQRLFSRKSFLIKKSGRSPDLRLIIGLPKDVITKSTFLSTVAISFFSDLKFNNKHHKNVTKLTVAGTVQERRFSIL
jgi:hypothetical protein